MDNRVAWAAGLIEGEGCFSLVKNYKAKGGKSGKLCVQMNDLDILERLQSIFNCGKIYYRKPRGNSKESWMWTVYRRDDLVRVATSVLPLLGKRRTEKVKEVLEYYGNNK